ncbi:MAG TPA: S9 family peptidase [Gemmatimonadales bacterium]|nr:S9 family peptidase [Gemmatimonadales bacterium]
MRLSLIFAAALISSGASAQTPAFDSVISLHQVGAAAISPDGRHVAFTVRTTDWKENKFDTEIWLARDRGEPIQLTRAAKGSSTTPRWSPDGKWIGFLSDREERQQVYLISALGGEAVQLTKSAASVNNFRWSPDGKAIAFSAAEAETEAMKQRKEKFGQFAAEDEDWSPVHLWLVEIDPDRLGTVPEARRLTEGTAFTVGGFQWSPDGRRIAFDHQVNPLINSGTTADISLIEVASKSITPLVKAPGGDNGPVWSPDGQWLVYGSSGGDTTSHFYRNNRLMKIAVTGGASTRLGTGFDEQIFGVTWTTGGIYFTGFEKTRRKLFRIDPASGTVQPVGDSPVTIFGVDFTPDGTAMAFTGQTASTLTEVYFAPVPAPGEAAVQAERITDATSQIASWPLGTSEVVSWKSRDGATIEGVLHKPRDFNPARKYPLLVVIHGGPTGIDLPLPVTGGVYPILQWVGQGALVLRPNYRGSAGYGEAFRALNVRNLGVGDMWDVMSGVDHLVRQGIVDTARMGAMGWSQGGYISAFLTTNTTRFKAISVGAGISNWVTYYVSTDIHPFTRQYLKANPWIDPAIYAKTSPMTNIRQAKTPTLIQHGEFDRRVPIQNAYELFQGLQDVGVPTRLVVYKGFGHGINKPKEQLAAMTHNWEWFGRYVFGGTGVAP